MGIKAAGNSFVNVGATAILLIPLFFSATGILLNSYSPLVDQDLFHSMQGKFMAAYMLLGDEAVRRCWPIAIAGCLACSSSIFHATMNAREIEENNVAGLFAAIEAIRAAAVVLIGLLIQRALGSASATGAAVANYVLLALLLFPWARIFEWKSPKPRATK